LTGLADGARRLDVHDDAGLHADAMPSAQACLKIVAPPPKWRGGRLQWAGLVGGEGFAVDASLIVADANKQRSTPGSQWNKELDAHAVGRATKESLGIRTSKTPSPRSDRRRFQGH